MKRVYILCLALIGCCAVTAYVAYTLGYRKSFDLSETIRYGDVIVSHDALVDLRSGRIDDGTRKVEAMYFKNAAILYGDITYKYLSIIPFSLGILILAYYYLWWKPMHKNAVETM